MRQEVFEIVQKMDKDNIRTQMALQCAPLITGLKVANLLIIPSKNEKYVGAILDGTDISYIRLAKSECKTTFFLYREERLTAWLMRAENRVLLTEAGYSGIILSDILQTILCGILGTGFAMASVIWEIDSWSLAKQSGINFSIACVTMFPIAYITNWMKHNAIGILSYVGIFVAIFVITWLVQYFVWKRKVKRMNDGVRKSNNAK